MQPDTALLLATTRLVSGTLELRARMFESEPQDVERLNAEVAALAGRARQLAATCDTSFRRLVERIELSVTEQAVIWLLATLASSEEARALMSDCFAHHGVMDPTLAMIRQLTYRADDGARAVAELGAGGTLRRLRLIERTDSDPHATEPRQTWGLSARAYAFLNGVDAVGEDIRAFAPVREFRAARVQTSCVDHARLQRALALPRSSVALVGKPGSGRRTLVGQAMSDAGMSWFEIDAAMLPEDVPGIASAAAACIREHVLSGRHPLLLDLDAMEPSLARRFVRMLSADLSEPLVATCSQAGVLKECGRPLAQFDVRKPTSVERAHLWEASLVKCERQQARLLAERYPLAPAFIVRAAEAASILAGERPVAAEDIVSSIRGLIDGASSDLATRVEVSQTWDDIVLTNDQVEDIGELLARVRERDRVGEEWGFARKLARGLGTAALLSGPPGTGKTMLAGLVAKELGLDIYQVDLAKVTSKWLGESEKNLGKLFDAAEAGNVILLFDEADALFGKRTGVKTSNDRHANLETNYLLQRLEAFSGICFLTTNHASNLDPAFQRRLSMHLQFEMPDLAERARLWRALLPAAAPRAESIDFELLAHRYELTGGYIRNAVLRTAFVSSSTGLPISTQLLDRSAQREYESMGRLPPRRLAS